MVPDTLKCIGSVIDHVLDAVSKTFILHPSYARHYWDITQYPHDSSFKEKWHRGRIKGVSSRKTQKGKVIGAGQNITITIITVIMLAASRSPVLLLGHVRYAQGPLPSPQSLHFTQMEKLSLRETGSKVNLLPCGRAESKSKAFCLQDLCSFYRLIVLSSKVMGSILSICLKKISFSCSKTFSSPFSKTRQKANH